MIGLVFVSHGKLADGLVDAMQMITGEQEAVRAVGFEETEEVECLMSNVDQAIQEVDQGDGVLILVDLFGATPFNASARLVLSRPEKKLEVVTGMNLPMILELVVGRQGLTLAEAADLVMNVGPESIRRMSETKGLEH